MSEEDKKQDNEGADVDMYHFRSHWTAILFIAFTVAFLIFALAALFLPQAV